MSRDDRRLKRLLTLIPVLRQRSGEKVEVLAAEFSMTPKELIDELNQVVLMCGTPPYTPHDYLQVHVEGDRVHLRLADHFRAPARLTLSEALSARLALEGLGPRAEGPFGAAGRSLRDKLARAMGGAPEGEVGAAPGGGRLAAALSVLDRAVRERRTVEMVYWTASRDAVSSRRMRPYGLIDHGGTWYAVGHCETRKAEMAFRVDRIREAKVLDEAFEVPKGFRIERYRVGKMYLPHGAEEEVEIRFSAAAAPWVREMIPGKFLKEEKGGTLRYTMLTASPEWVARWVLEWGGDAEVVKPAGVRRAVREMCEKILSNENNK